MRTLSAVLGLAIAACASRAAEKPALEPAGGDPSVPTALAARLIDERALPLAGRSLHFFLCPDDDSSPGRDGWIKSDPNGRIRLELLPEELSRNTQYLKLSDLKWGGPRGETKGELYLRRGSSGFELDLGDLLVAPRGSIEQFKYWSDAEVRAEYERLKVLHSWRTEMFEALLCEMIRRGGSMWAEFVETEFAERCGPGSELAFGGERTPGTVTLLTAARRLRGRPDPLAIRVEADMPLEFPTNERPKLRLVWSNVDERESLTLCLPSKTVARSGIVNLEIVDPAGQPLVPRMRYDSENDMMNGVGHPETLAPGDSRTVSLPLDQYMPWSMPAGEYRVRVRYHERCRIVEDQQFAGLIMTSSPEFVVRIRAP